MTPIKLTDFEKIMLQGACSSRRVVARTDSQRDCLNRLTRKGWLEKRTESDDLYSTVMRDYYYITHNGCIVAKALGLAAVQS